MAAYAALVTLSKSIEQILPFQQHYSFLCHKHQMESLLHKVISLQEFLEHISEKSSDGVDELESRIRDVAYRLEDIVEPILVYSLAVEYQNETNTQLSIQEANTEVVVLEQNFTQVSYGSSGAYGSLSQSEWVFRLTAGHDSTLSSSSVESEWGISFFRELFNKLCVTCFTAPTDSVESEMEASLDDILGWCLDQDLKNKAKFSHLPLMERAAAAFGNCTEEVDLLEEAMETRNKVLDNKLVISGTSILPHDIATTSLSKGPPDANDTMVGLRDDLQQILDKINRRERALQVIPITGMGGIGKTTLARAVYDHHGKQGHFDLVLWATVSQQYNVKDILRVLCPDTTCEAPYFN